MKRLLPLVLLLAIVGVAVYLLTRGAAQAPVVGGLLDEARGRVPEYRAAYLFANCSGARRR